MTDDREKHEWAAKAAGYSFKWGKDWHDKGVFHIHEGTGSQSWRPWNPLDDDGDALRLAVKLTLEVDVCQTGVAVRTPTGVKVLVDSKEEPNAYAATRRAIVRAAAEIGKGMK